MPLPARTNSVVESTDERRASIGNDSHQEGLGWLWQLIAIGLAVALVISRQPSAVTHAQFFAEDGHVWFADAYNLGWLASLFRTYSGYYQTLPRLAAALALLVPLASAPLLMNLVGLFIQILPVPILLSARLSDWGSLPLRASFALIYLALPNCREIHVTVANAQWHLALVACLLVVASAPRSKGWKCFDVAVWVLCGLTGPFCVVLFPIAGIMLWLRRETWRWIAAVIFALTSAIQANALLFTDHAARSHSWKLGANIEWLTRLLASQVYLGTLLGRNALAFSLGIRFLAWTAAIGTALFVYWLFKADVEIRLFVAFTLLLFAASLSSPLMTAPPPGMTAWQVLALAPGMRYWFFPTLACSWMIVWFLAGHGSNQVTQLIGGLLLFVMSYGLIRDFQYPALPDLHFAQYANELAHSKPGEALVIPENPRGWTIRLTHRDGSSGEADAAFLASGSPLLSYFQMRYSASNQSRKPPIPLGLEVRLKQ